MGILVSILYRIYRLCKKQNLFCRVQVGAHLDPGGMAVQEKQARTSLVAQ